MRHKKQISNVKYENCIDTVVELTTIYLHDKGIKYLALDFDGVLASHGKSEPSPEVIAWLDNFSKDFGEDNIFILSNKPTQERLDFFAAKYPKIRFIAGIAKKPYPDGMLKIRDIVKCDANELALVDDRLLTGCLACIIAGCYPILITKPYIDKMNYDSKERFFSFLRFSEQLLFF
jgi:hypothetical protein